MTEHEWQSCSDPDPMVRSIAAQHFQKELRLFAVACARRAWDLLPESCRQAIDVSEKFAWGQADVQELEHKFAAACAAPSAADRGGMAPDASAYATSAAVDASSLWPRTAGNVLSAVTCAASAVACAAADQDESRYDEMFNETRAAEFAAQAELLRRLLAYPGKPPS